MPIVLKFFRLTISTMVLAATAISAKADFTFADFSDVSALQLSGSAVQAGTALQLSPASAFTSGSAFMRESVSLGNRNSFSTYFQFRILDSGGISDGDGIGADGLVFVVQTVANNVGGAGGFIGYGGIANSFGIEFDTWDNGASFADPDGNHVGLNLNGDIASVAVASEASRFNNGSVWSAWVDYNGVTNDLQVRWSQSVVRPEHAQLSRAVDLVSVLGSDNAFVGFTSGTGSAWGDHQILNWKYVGEFAPIPTIPEPASAYLLMCGALLMAAAARLSQRGA